MITTATGEYFSGTSNIVLPVSNKQFFPQEFQEKSRLCYYASLFNSVEINSTFYKLPLAKTVAKWANEVPDNFRFTFKLWQEITHIKGHQFNPENVMRFMEIVNQVDDKKGCILMQFPPGVIFSPVLLDNLLSEINLGNSDSSWHVAVEFRHESWYQDITYQMLDHHLATMVLHDLPACIAPTHTSEADNIYLRFHGPEGGYRGSYSNDFLYKYARYVKGWMADGKTVYTYFNNTIGEEVRNLITFNKYVKS